jgi:hypothetical protein
MQLTVTVKLKTTPAQHDALLYADTNTLSAELSAPSISCRMAAACARHWLEFLDCGLSKEWKLIGAPEPYSKTISMLLLRGRQRMFVQVNAQNGSLGAVRRAGNLDGESDGRRESSVPEMQN